MNIQSLFRRRTTATTWPMKPVKNIVEQIHKEFNTASDNALEEANKLLKQDVSLLQEKGSRLAKLGFDNTKEAQAAREIMQGRMAAKELSEAVLDYRVRYPFNKFITKEQVSAICKKYNLVCGDVRLYKGTVPEKNLLAIERFKLQEQDEIMEEVYRIDVRIRDTKTILSRKEAQRRKKRHREMEDYNHSYNEVPLKICAPPSDMDTRNMTSKDGFLQREIQDPIVLQPVKDGYLIVTAWGEEASDENVVNSVNN